jgi:hypothetical protein
VLIEECIASLLGLCGQYMIDLVQDGLSELGVCAGCLDYHLKSSLLNEDPVDLLNSPSLFSYLLLLLLTYYKLLLNLLKLCNEVCVSLPILDVVHGLHILDPRFGVDYRIKRESNLQWKVKNFIIIEVIPLVILSGPEPTRFSTRDPDFTISFTVDKYLLKKVTYRLLI